MIALKVFMALLILAMAVSILSILGLWPTTVSMFDAVVNVFLLAMVIYGHNMMLSNAVAHYQCPICNTVMDILPGRKG